MTRRYSLIYDIELQRPACVLIQETAGIDYGSDRILSLWPASAWLDHPTPGMRRMVGTCEEWERIAALEPREEP